MSKAEIAKALAVTAEVMGTELSDAALKDMVEELSEYPIDQVLRALRRVKREHMGRLTLAAIISRLDCGHPGPEEAWAMVRPALGDESVTVVWTREMLDAYRAAAPLADDPVAARMAFLERYRRLLSEVRGPAEWRPIFGYDKAGRKQAVEEAVQLGRLPKSTAVAALRQVGVEMEYDTPRLEHKSQVVQLRELRKKLQNKEAGK